LTSQKWERDDKEDGMPILSRCISLCREAPARVVLPDGEDARAVSAALRLVREGLGAVTLMGRPFAVQAIVREVIRNEGGAPAPLAVVDPASPELLERNILDYMALREGQGKPVPRDEAAKSMRRPLAAGAMMVRRKEAEVGVGGNISSTADTLRAGIRVIGTEPGRSAVSGFFFMISPGNALGDRTVAMFADAGVIPEPTVAQLAEIAIASAGQYADLMRDTPRVAMLSFSSHGSARHPRAERMREAADLVKAKAPYLAVDGELQFDAAAVPSVAARKVPESPLGGRANVFIFPSLEAGNIAYKIAERLGGYTALGPLLQGLDGGWHDLSRGCSAGDIYQVALTGTALERIRARRGSRAPAA
jgi:phosphotransacetylase